MTQRAAAILALLALGAASACSPSPAPAPQAPRPTPPPTSLDSAASGTEVASFSYDPTKRDPFRSFIAGVYDGANAEATSPLERFDLTQLELSAIIWGIDAPRALITDPSGKGYIVSTGMVLGKNKGRVISIGDNSVIVKETYVDSFDRATTKPVEMRLRTTEGG